MNYFIKKMDEIADAPHTIPILAQVNEHIPQICGLPYDYLFRDDPVAMAECTLLTWEYYDLNTVIANLDVYNFEAESMGQKLDFFPQNIPDIDRSDFLIKSSNDLGKIKFNGLDSGRFPYLLKYFAAMRDYIGTVPPQNLCAPWSLACNIYGLENLVIACFEEPDFVHDMMNALVDSLYIPMFKSLVSVFPDLTYWQLADAWASPPMTNIDIISEFIEPYYNRLNTETGIDGFVTEGVGIWGFAGLPEKDYTAYADYLVKVSGKLSGLDPDLEKLEVEWFNRYAVENDVPLMLGIDTNLLQVGPQEAFVGRINDYIAKGSKDSPKLIFFLNTISPHTPSENVHMAIAAVKALESGTKADCRSLARSMKKTTFEEFVKGKMARNEEGYTFDWVKKSVLSL